jgi:hypothetical protein
VLAHSIFQGGKTTNKFAVETKRVHSFRSVQWSDWCACILSATLSSPSCLYEFPVFNLHSISGFGSRVRTWSCGCMKENWGRLLFRHRVFLQHIVVPLLLHTDVWDLPNETLSGIFLDKGLEPLKSSVHGSWASHPIDSPVSWSLPVPELRGLHHCAVDLTARNGVSWTAFVSSGAGKTKVSAAYSAKIWIWDISVVIMARLRAGLLGDRSSILGMASSPTLESTHLNI